MKTKLIAAALAGVLSCAPLVAMAAAPKPAEQAKQLYTQGMEAMATKHFDDAAKAFDEAATLVDDPILVWNAGRAYHQAGKLEEAKARYNQCLTRPDFPPDKRELIAKYLIEIDRASRPEDKPHDVAVIKNPEPETPAESPSTVGPWVMIVGGAAVLIGGVALHFVAEGDRDDVTGGADPDGVTRGMTQAEAKDAEDSANTLDTIGAIGVGVGAAAAVGGIVWLVLTPSGRESSGSVHVTGAPMSGGGSLVVFGSFLIQRGDLYWLAPDPERTPDASYQHPHVVVQDDVFNHARVATVIVCALTTNLGRADEPGNVLLEPGEGDLPKQSVVVVSQIMSVAKAALGERIGALSSARVDEIIDGLRFQQRAFFR